MRNWAVPSFYFGMRRFFDIPDTCQMSDVKPRIVTEAAFGALAANSPFVPRCVNSCTVRRKSVFRLLHLGHSTNTVAANYGSGYALEVMREHLEKVWQ